MRKVVLLLPFLAFIFACENKATQKNAESLQNTDLIQLNLKGEVKNLTEMTYTADSTGNMDKMDSLVNVYDFDDKGYLTRFHTKDQGGAVKTEQTFIRNDKGALNEFITKKDGKQTYRLVTEIDKDGKYSGGVTYDSTGKQDSYFKDLATNEYGIVYAGKQYDMNNKIKSTWDMKYDKANFLGGTSTDSTGKPSYTGTVVLNEKGDPAEETSATRDKDTTKTEKMVYKYDTYDDKGNWVQRTTYNEKEKPSKIIKRTFIYYKD
jgi:hypothetical protein